MLPSSLEEYMMWGCSYRPFPVPRAPRLWAPWELTLGEDGEVVIDVLQCDQHSSCARFPSKAVGVPGFHHHFIFGLNLSVQVCGFRENDSCKKGPVNAKTPGYFAQLIPNTLT